MMETDRQGLTLAGDEAGATAPEGPSVAALLKEARESSGLDLGEIAAQLRIRRIYLQAIEDGRFDELPGPAYAVGFVRAFAEQLGLDGEEMVKRFKAETSGLERAPELLFPSPLPESRFPGGAVLIVSLVLAAAVYGGWHHLSSRDRATVELVPDVPERMVALVAEPKPDVAVTPDQEAAEAGEPAALSGGQGRPAAASAAIAPPQAPGTGMGQDRDIGQATSGAELAAAGVSEPAAPEATPQGAPPEGAGAASADMPESEAGEALEAVASPATGGGSASPARDVDPRSASEAAPAAPTPPIPETQVATADPQVPMAFGEGGADARIVLRAKLDSWVQVRDEENNVLMTRILRLGDTYRAPNRPGLTLLTGNAGALEILVDGNVVPSIGPIGAVRRNVALDAERLLAGRAVDE
ncbi:MAG: helix-turn-helix domain-containing protein [Alphaproteobacteria bacterium]